MRERWFSKRALSLHLGVLFFVPGCIAAGWWQVTRAMDGNGLSYLYSVEWPIFAILGIYFWWMLIHTDFNNVGLKGMRNQHPEDAATPDGVPPAGVPALAAAPLAAPPPPPEVDDPELAAYNARLAELAAQGPKTWRHKEATVVRRSPAT